MSKSLKFFIVLFLAFLAIMSYSSNTFAAVNMNSSALNSNTLSSSNTSSTNTGVWQFWNKKIFESIMNAYFFCQIFIFFLSYVVVCVII